LPPIFTPNLEQVLTEGNTSDIDILLDANLEALDVSADTATVGVNLTLGGTITDNSSAVGSAGQVLSSTVTGVAWVSLPVYSATSPLLFNPATGVFSIQVANSTQGGYLTANDWITFNGKQDAGSYITALTGEATATGPGSVPITLNNASVTAKVLTGLNVTGGSISASDSILTAFGKVQSQINGLMGGVQYQGVWNAATNTPTLTSSVGTQGHYYIVNVAGNTDLNGITDWKVGDWAIFSGGTWQKVDNTESVTSVNGQVGAVSLTTDDIPEGSTNLYYLNSRARGALSFAAGSGAYNSLTGVITIPTDNNQILNGAGYITLSSISATSPLAYNNLTGVFSIQQADATHNGYLSSTDWSTFNGKQNYLGGTGLVKSTAGTITYITDNSGNWNTAYNRSIVSAAVTGTTTKTLTLNEQDGNTITASWTDLDTGLTSVGVSMPSAFSVANSPLTSNGTIAVTGAGTTLEYIDGTGALRTFPGLTGYVPYTGATQNVNLGEFGISAGYFQADLTPTGALQVGRMQWNSTDGTMDLRLLGNNVTLQIGQENVTRVVNKSGIDLLEANYQVVRIRKVAEGGAQGQRLAVVLAQGNNENNSTEVIGLVTETINVNQEGFVTSFGEVKSINTTGSLQGETWVDGDILYLSSTVAGQLTNIRPIAPNHSVIVGYVVYAHVNNGKIYMAIDTGYELGELHNVYAPSPTANQSIYWNVANSRYQLNTIGGILGYTPANAATTISTTAPLQGGGDLSANRTFSITQSGASTDGYLSSTDWNTFNNKQPAGSYVPTSRQLTINGTAYDLSADRSWSVGTVTSVAALTLGTTGTDLSSSVATGTTTPVITLNVPTASAANRGALSAADWSTFNTKVGGVTATSPLASSGGQTPNITIQQSSGSQDGYLSSTDWTTFNNKQAAGNYITSLTGEATATGPGAAAVTLNNASVTGKVLTGVNITGGTVQATDTMLTAFGKLQNQINGLIGSTIYQGTWNASTNTPALASGVGVRGYYYIVSVAGNTNLDGITDWFIGDWAIFDGTAWQQVDNTDAVVSVNGQTGAVSLTTDNIPEGATNQYFLNSRARAALSFVAGSGAYNSTTGVITIPTNNNQITNGANYITLASLSGTAPISYNSGTGAISITQSGTASNGYLSSTDWNTFNNKQVAGNYVTLDTTQTITGDKTFNAYTAFSTGQIVYFNGNVSVNNGLSFSDTGAAAIFTNAQAFNVTRSGTTSSITVRRDNVSGLSYSQTLSFSNNAANHTYTFPDATGTVALTSDLASYVPYTGATGAVNLGTYGLTAYSLYLKKNGTNGSNIIWDTTSGQVIANTGQTSIGPVGADGFGVYFEGATKAFYFSATNITAQRIYTMPNASGTIALVGGSGVGTVTSVAALTIGTTGTDLSSTVANSTTTPVITLNVPTASAANRGALSAADWTTFNSKAPSVAGGYLPLSGGTMTGVIGLPNGAVGIQVGDDATIADRNVSNTMYVAGVQNTDRGYINFSETAGNQLGAINGGALTWRGANVMTTANISGTTNYIPKFTAANTIGNSIVQDDGRVITITSTDGTGARTTLNDVLTITQLNPNAPYSGFGTGILFRGNTYIGNYMWGRIAMQLTDFSGQTTGENMIFQVAPADNSDTLTTVLTLAYNSVATFSGSVGIGVSPTQSLDVNGNGKFRGQDLLLGSSVDADNVIYIYSKNGAQSQIRTNAGVSSSYNGMMIASNYNQANSLSSWSIDLGGALNSTSNVNSYTLGYKAFGGAWASLMTVSATGAAAFSNTITSGATINSGDSVTLLGELYWGGTTTGQKARAYTSGSSGSATLNYAFWNGTTWNVKATLDYNGTATFSDNILIGAGKYLGYSASAYMTPEDNVQGAKVKTPGGFLVESAGAVKLTNLAGTGTRMVVTDASGNLSTQAIGSGSITGSGTTNYVPKFTSSTAIGNSVIIDNGSDVTVGSVLRVNALGNVAGGTIRMGAVNDSTAKWAYLVSTQYNSSTNPSGFSVIGTYSTATANQIVIGGSIYEANPATEIQFWTHTAVTHGTGGSKRMVIDTNGNVGIEQSTPTTRLEVQATDGSGGRTSPINIVTITAENPSNPYNGFGGGLLFKNRIYAGGPTPGGIRDGARIRTSINGNSSTDLGTELVFDVTTTGAGALTEALRLSYDYGATFSLKNIIVNNSSNPYAASNRGSIFLNGASTSLYGWGVGGAGKGYMYHEGTNVYLENSVSSGAFNIVQVGAGSINLQTNGTNRLIINGSGNAKFSNSVGIGMDPTYNLDVNGIIRGADRLKWNGESQLVYILNYNQIPNADTTTVADSTASNGYALQKSGGSSTFFYGNYTSFPPGNYTAYFRLKVASNASGSYLGQLDVVGANCIGFAISVLPNMFDASNTWQYIKLPFTITGGGYIEWRFISWTGVTNTFFDHIMIYQEGGEGKVFTRNAYSIYVNQNTLGMQINTSGAMTVTSSVTATSFFESSDSRLKNLIKDDYRAIGIETIKPKLYIKDGREEVGYFAQDVQGLLSTAVTKNDAGFLSLSYTQVHTAKIAIIEDEVDVLKKEVSELKVKLQKYEA
jgi:hypothetical protein